MADTTQIADFLSEIVVRLKPQDPTKGPPLPTSLDISWPGFFARGIQRITTEGVKAPYKTAKEKGLLEELKREIQIVTGWRPK
jgi:hypothetical protein